MLIHNDLLIEPAERTPEPEGQQFDVSQSDCGAVLSVNAANTASDDEKIYSLTRTRNAAGRPAWRVYVFRRGKQFVRTFTDSRFGGAEAAKAHALAWRDEIVRKHPVMGARERAALKRSSNTSGIPGVRFEEYSYRPARWTAYCHLPNGCTRTKCFNVSVHGYEGAYQLAVAARQDMLLQIGDHELPLHVKEPVSRSVPPRVVNELVVPNAREQFLATKQASSSPMPGLYRWVRKRKNGNQLVMQPMWVAQFKQLGMPLVRRYFSVEKYGEDDARQLAYAQHLCWQNGEPAVPDKRGVVSQLQRVMVRGASGEHAVWLVTYRLPSGPTGGRKLQKSFAEGRYGAEQAQAMAEKQRQLWLQAVAGNVNKALPRHELPNIERPKPAKSQEPRIMVSRIVGKARLVSGAQLPRPFWQATYRWPDGRKRLKRFSVTQHGEENAKALAHAVAQEWRVAPPHPVVSRAKEVLAA